MASARICPTVNLMYPAVTAGTRLHYHLVASMSASLLAWTPGDMCLLFHIYAGHVFQGTPAALASLLFSNTPRGFHPRTFDLPFPPPWKTPPSPLHGSLPHQLYAQMSPPQRPFLKSSLKRVPSVPLT